jgi:hypothetical protein
MDEEMELLVRPSTSSLAANTDEDDAVDGPADRPAIAGTPRRSRPR